MDLLVYVCKGSARQDTSTCAAHQLCWSQGAAAAPTLSSSYSGSSTKGDPWTALVAALTGSGLVVACSQEVSQLVLEVQQTHAVRIQLLAVNMLHSCSIAMCM